MFVQVLPTKSAVGKVVAAQVLLDLARTLSAAQTANLAISGGSAAEVVLPELVKSELRYVIDWSAVHLWWADERFVAPSSKDRNDVRALEILAGLIPNVHRIGDSQEFASAEDAAARYSEALKGIRLDIAILGVGSDGHVASVFPNHSSSDNSEQGAMAVYDSPKPPPTRVSLTPPQLASIERPYIVALGKSKREALLAALDPQVSATQLPAKRLPATWYVDLECAGRP
ncbi:MAG: 6-phosphogluconolactonase [Actinomycetaceae bacterium]|nr:6-phosphogluconolactonase [Actinomycetaceae bacterium]